MPEHGVPEYGVLTPQRIAKWTSAGLVLVGALSVLVGFASFGWKGFHWEVASVFGTALGTTALAAFTGALAYTTSGDVRATWELARLTQRDQDARERPLLIQYEAAFNGSPQSGQIRVVLFNAGLGPALRVEVNIRYLDPEHPFETTYIEPAIRAEGTGELLIPVQFTEPYPQGGIRGDGFAVSGTYRDRSQRNVYDIITAWE